MMLYSGLPERINSTRLREFLLLAPRTAGISGAWHSCQPAGSHSKVLFQPRARRVVGKGETLAAPSSLHTALLAFFLGQDTPCFVALHFPPRLPPRACTLAGSKKAGLTHSMSSSGVAGLLWVWLCSPNLFQVSGEVERGSAQSFNQGLSKYNQHLKLPVLFPLAARNIPQ